MTKAVSLHVKEDFWGKRKVWGHSFPLSKAFYAALMRQRKLAHSTVEDVSACDFVSRPNLIHSNTPPYQLHIYSSRKQTSLSQRLTDLMLTSRASTFKTAPSRITIDDKSQQKVTKSMLSEYLKLLISFHGWKSAVVAARWPTKHVQKNGPFRC